MLDREICADEEQVSVTPPMKLMEPVMSGQEALQLVQAWQAGGYSFETLHQNLQRGQIAPMDRDAEEELRLMDQSNFREEPSSL